MPTPAKAGAGADDQNLTFFSPITHDFRAPDGRAAIAANS